MSGVPAPSGAPLQRQSRNSFNELQQDSSRNKRLSSLRATTIYQTICDSTEVLKHVGKSNGTDGNDKTQMQGIGTQSSLDAEPNNADILVGKGVSGRHGAVITNKKKKRRPGPVNRDARETRNKRLKKGHSKDVCGTREGQHGGIDVAAASTEPRPTPSASSEISINNTAATKQVSASDETVSQALKVGISTEEKNATSGVFLLIFVPETTPNTRQWKEILKEHKINYIGIEPLHSCSFPYFTIPAGKSGYLIYFRNHPLGKVEMGALYKKLVPEGDSVFRFKDRLERWANREQLSNHFRRIRLSADLVEKHEIHQILDADFDDNLEHRFYINFVQENASDLDFTESIKMGLGFWKSKVADSIVVYRYSLGYVAVGGKEAKGFLTEWYDKNREVGIPYSGPESQSCLMEMYFCKRGPLQYPNSTEATATTEAKVNAENAASTNIASSESEPSNINSSGAGPTKPESTNLMPASAGSNTERPADQNSDNMEASNILMGSEWKGTGNEATNSNSTQNQSKVKGHGTRASPIDLTTDIE